MGELVLHDVLLPLQEKIEKMEKLIQNHWRCVLSCHIYSILLFILLRNFDLVGLRQLSLVVSSLFLQFCLIAVGTCIALISLLYSFINNRQNSDMFYWNLVFILLDEIDSFLSNIAYFLFIGIFLRISLVTQEKFVLIFFLYSMLFLSFFVLGVLVKYVMTFNIIIYAMNVSKISTIIEFNEKNLRSNTQKRPESRNKK